MCVHITHAIISPTLPFTLNRTVLVFSGGVFWQSCEPPGKRIGRGGGNRPFLHDETDFEWFPLLHISAYSRFLVPERHVIRINNNEILLYYIDSFWPSLRIGRRSFSATGQTHYALAKDSVVYVPLSLSLFRISDDDLKILIKKKKKRIYLRDYLFFDKTDRVRGNTG